VNGAQGGPPVKSDLSLVQQLEALANEIEHDAGIEHDSAVWAFESAARRLRAVLEGTKTAAMDDALVARIRERVEGMIRVYPGYPLQDDLKYLLFMLGDPPPAPSAVVVDDTRQDDTLGVDRPTAYLRFDGMTWPNPNADWVEWELRYGDTEAVRLTAASFVHAYIYLVSLPQKLRNQRIQQIRHAAPSAGGSPSQGPGVDQP
jgi:hypothetical protein